MGNISINELVLTLYAGERGYYARACDWRNRFYR